MRMREPNWLLLIAAALTLVIVVIGVTMDEADASDYQPYGGCKEAIDYPRTEGADICRRHGWTVTRHIIVRPDGYVVAWQNLPRCDRAETFPCHGKGWRWWVNSGKHLYHLKGVA